MIFLALHVNIWNKVDLYLQTRTFMREFLKKLISTWKLWTLMRDFLKKNSITKCGPLPMNSFLNVVLDLTKCGYMKKVDLVVKNVDHYTWFSEKSRPLYEGVKWSISSSALFWAVLCSSDTRPCPPKILFCPPLPSGSVILYDFLSNPWPE